jgi:hypothetical protein
MVIVLACRGTIGSPYIEDRRYEIDETGTSRVVTEENFRASFEDGKMFEVAIVLKDRCEEKGRCPGCGHLHRVPDEGGEWIRWCVCFRVQASEDRQSDCVGCATALGVVHSSNISCKMRAMTEGWVRLDLIQSERSECNCDLSRGQGLTNFWCIW